MELLAAVQPAEHLDLGLTVSRLRRRGVGGGVLVVVTGLPDEGVLAAFGRSPTTSPAPSCWPWPSGRGRADGLPAAPGGDRGHRAGERLEPGLAHRNGALVVYRYGWLAGIAGGLFALVRLERLLRSSWRGCPGRRFSSPPRCSRCRHLGGPRIPARHAHCGVDQPGCHAAHRGASGRARHHLVRLPHPLSFRALGSELGYALDVIRTGVAPVLPMAGVVAILTALFWVLGALLSWGLRRDRPYVAVLAPLVVYLQFATMDRRRSGAWTLLFLLLLGLALLAVATDRRRRAPDCSPPGGDGRRWCAPGPRWRPGPWPAPGGHRALHQCLGRPPSPQRASRVAGALRPHGDYYGSISYNPFVGIHQALVSPPTPLC